MSTTVNPTECPIAEPVCYRLNRHMLWTAVFCLPCFITMFGCMGYLLVTDAESSAPPALFILAGLEGTFMGLGIVWVIAAYFRDRLTVSADAITYQDCFSRRTIQANDVTAIDWKSWGGRARIVVRSGDARITVELASFTRDDRRKMISQIRQRFSSELQSGWTPFQERFFPTTPRPTESARTAVLCAVLFIVAGIGFGYGWWLGLDVEFLFACLGCSVFGATYFWRIRRWLKKKAAECAA